MARTRYPTLASRLQLSNIRGPSGIGAREASRTSDILQRELNKMSDFFSKRAVAQAEIEGAEFGAKNAITEKQLRDGSLSGEELENQLGDTNTVFGRASRKAQLSILETELELSARKQISEIMTNAVTNDVDADTLSDDLDSVTLAYSKLAFDASPIVARRLTASLNTVSSSKYHEYAVKKANETIKITRAKNLAVINNNLNDLSTALIKSVNEAEDEAQIDDILNNQVKFMKQNYFNKVTKFAKTAKPINDFLDKFDAEFEEFKYNFVLSNTLQNGKQGAVARAISTNNYSKIDFRLKKVIGKMNPDQKMEMFKKLNAQAKEVQQAEDQNDAIAEASSQDKIVDLKIKILENLGEKNRDIDTAKSLLGQLKTLDRDGDDYLSLSEKLIKVQDESDPDIYDSLKDLSDRGVLTSEALNINADKLSGKDLDQLRNELKTIQSAKMKLALSDLTGYFNTEFPGFDPKIIDNMGKKNQFLKPLAQYKKIKAELGRALEEAQAEGKDIDLEKLTKNKFDNFKTTILDKVAEQNLARAKAVIKKVKATIGSAFSQLENIDEDDYSTMFEFLISNKTKISGGSNAFTSREFEIFKKNLKTALDQ
tara:strand:- start:1568 stop:3361 length:1794 start_codon:yes stop_codon:yes gene_type:complete